MEALLNGKGYNHSYRSSTIIVFAVTNQATKTMTLQVDGFSTTISSGNQV